MLCAGNFRSPGYRTYSLSPDIARHITKAAIVSKLVLINPACRISHRQTPDRRTGLNPHAGDEGLVEMKRNNYQARPSAKQKTAISWPLDLIVQMPSCPSPSRKIRCHAGHVPRSGSHPSKPGLGRRGKLYSRQSFRSSAPLPTMVSPLILPERPRIFLRCDCSV